MERDAAEEQTLQRKVLLVHSCRNVLVHFDYLERSLIAHMHEMFQDVIARDCKWYVQL